MATGEEQTMIGSLIKTSDLALSAEDLIHPHEASDIPGYNGYTPQLKFNCGHTYGCHTDKLTKRHMKNEKLMHTGPDHTTLRDTYLPKHSGDRKYVEKMVPGYTGYVPIHRFKFGGTYKEGTETAVTEFKMKDSNHRHEQLDLHLNTMSYPRLQIRKDFPPPDPSHPGTNLRYATAYYGKHFNDHREFTENPIPGYTGYVPKKMEHNLGSRYGTWSGKAYTDSLKSQQLKTSISKVPVRLGRSLPTKLPEMEEIRVYKKDGMVPKYTGYVPQRRFDFGMTYGDTTRSLAVCYDSPGYAAGDYNSTGPKFDRITIRV